MFKGGNWDGKRSQTPVGRMVTETEGALPVKRGLAGSNKIEAYLILLRFTDYRFLFVCLFLQVPPPV